MQNQKLAQELFQIGALKFGTFTLKSGIESPIYIDLRLIISYPKLLQQIADLMWEKVAHQSHELICGVPYTALPIATAISLKQNLPMVMRRKEIKDYGTKRSIEGSYQAGQSCLLIEDLVTSGTSVFETINPLQHEGLKITDIVVLIDREQGGRKNIESRGYRLHSVLTLSEILETLQSSGQLDHETVARVIDFIESNQTTTVG